MNALSRLRVGGLHWRALARGLLEFTALATMWLLVLLFWIVLAPA